MRSLRMAGIGLVLVVTACTPAAEEPAAEPAPPPAPDITAGTDPVFRDAAELPWADLDPVNAPGVKLAPVWGNPGEGAFGAYMLLPAGFASPLHTHTHPMKVVFVSGTYIQEPEGGAAVRLGPGSFMMQPGGSYRHWTRCAPEADCVFFVESAGAFDLQAVVDSSGTN